MAAKDLPSMTDKQLESAWTKAAKEAEELQAQLREFARENERRIERRNAEEALANMSDSEKEALAQVIKAEGIESREKMGNI